MTNEFQLFGFSSADSKFGRVQEERFQCRWFRAERVLIAAAFIDFVYSVNSTVTADRSLEDAATVLTFNCATRCAP